MIASRTYMKTSHPYAYATFTDFEKGKGLLQIHSDWGIYHAYWGSTGRDNLEDFVLSCDDYYLRKNLITWQGFMGVKKTHVDLVDKFLDECWPELKQIIKDDLKAMEDF